jgi:flagellin-specific chaperone FliS
MDSENNLGGSPMNSAEARKEYAKHYKQIAAQTDMHVASPYKIIQLLMQGALDRIASAKGLLHEKDYGKMGIYK